MSQICHNGRHDGLNLSERKNRSTWIHLLGSSVIQFMRHIIEWTISAFYRDSNFFFTQLWRELQPSKCITINDNFRNNWESANYCNDSLPNKKCWIDFKWFKNWWKWKYYDTFLQHRIDEKKSRSQLLIPQSEKNVNWSSNQSLESQCLSQRIIN